MYFRRNIGIYGEELVCEYLQENNYHIKDRNFYNRQGEIDIIAYDKTSKEIVFVEVKTRTNTKYIKPVEAVNGKKQIHIIKVAKHYLYIKKLENAAVRFDVIEVYLNKKNIKINHLKQII